MCKDFEGFARLLKARALCKIGALLLLQSCIAVSGVSLKASPSRNPSSSPGGATALPISVLSSSGQEAQGQTLDLGSYSLNSTPEPLRLTIKNLSATALQLVVKIDRGASISSAFDPNVAPQSSTDLMIVSDTSALRSRTSLIHVSLQEKENASRAYAFSLTSEVKPPLPTPPRLSVLVNNQEALGKTMSLGSYIVGDPAQPVTVIFKNLGERALHVQVPVLPAGAKWTTNVPSTLTLNAVGTSGDSASFAAVADTSIERSSSSGIAVILNSDSQTNPAYRFSFSTQVVSPTSISVPVAFTIICQKSGTTWSAPPSPNTSSWTVATPPAGATCNPRGWSAANLTKWLSRVNALYSQSSKALVKFSFMSVNYVNDASYYNMPPPTNGEFPDQLIYQKYGIDKERGLVQNVFIMNTLYGNAGGLTPLGGWNVGLPTVSLGASAYASLKDFVWDTVLAHELFHGMGINHAADGSPTHTLTYDHRPNCGGAYLLSYTSYNQNAFLLSDSSGQHCERNNVMSYSASYINISLDKSYGGPCNSPSFFTPAHANTFKAAMQCFSVEHAHGSFHVPGVSP